MRLLFRFFIIICVAVSVGFAKPKKQPSEQDIATIDQNISDIQTKLAQTDKSLDKNIWYKRYRDYTRSKEIIEELAKTREKISHVKRTRPEGYEETLEELSKNEDNLKRQLAILGDFKNSIFGDMVKVDTLATVPTVDSPIAVFHALSYIKDTSYKKDTYESRLVDLQKTIDILSERERLNYELEQQLSKKTDQNTSAQVQALKQANDIESQNLKDLKKEKDDFFNTVEAFNAKSQEIVQKLQQDIKYQLFKLGDILLIIIAIIAVSFVSKILIRRYSGANHERAYLLAKSVNIASITLIVFIVLFSYINNVGYLVAILGFASAGIAIAMKDWFMSLMGWLTIVVGGSIKVGDRIKITSKEGVEILGDVIDISLLTITLYEQVSLVSLKSKRAGRVVFVPNNYIFTHIFLNYSHSELSTVWDNVEITISFDSDIDEAVSLAVSIAERHTKTFTKLTERAIRRMKATYSMGDTFITEARAFSFLANNGVTISVWYLVYSYKILKYKSIIGKEILAAFMASDKIKIALPATSIVMGKDVNKHD